MFDSNAIFDKVEQECLVNEEITIYIGKLKDYVIYQYLLQCDNDFLEPLSARDDLSEYSLTLNNLATSFVLVCNGCVAGLVFTYFYDRASKNGFITLVHLRNEYRGRHLSVFLMDSVRRYGQALNFDYLELAVYRKNTPAFNLYTMNGFQVIYEEGGRCLMRCDLRDALSVR